MHDPNHCIMAQNFLIRCTVSKPPSSPGTVMNHSTAAATCRDRACQFAAQRDREGIDVRAVKFADLGSDEIHAWSELQRGLPEFESPFFRPEFSAILTEFQPDTEVAVLRSAGRCVGFWPFQRRPGNIAHADGNGLRSYEGVVCDPAVSWSPQELLKGCRLSAWKFDHLLASQSGLGGFHWSLSTSPVIDLELGAGSYLDRKRKERSHTIELVLRNRRRVERELGRVRLVPATDDEQVLEAIIEWKRAYFGRVRCIDRLAPPWRRGLLRRVAAFRSEDFSGMVSALYAGRHLLAAHLGIRSGQLLHGWFPVYNRDFREYSPGIMMWAMLADVGPELGIRRIDLGTGPQYFKDRLKTGELFVAEGAVDPWFLRRAFCKGWWRTRRAILASPLANPLRKAIRTCRALRGYEIDERNVCWSHVVLEQAGTDDDR
jgi:CelD/BcsL family acetyltransferase involved in cellulose biosynthesis